MALARWTGFGMERATFQLGPKKCTMPASAAEIWRRIGLEGDPASARVPADAAWGQYPGGVPVVKGDPLFPRRKG